MATDPRRYTAAAIALHWAMAAGILSLIAIGLVMVHGRLEPSVAFPLYQLHKSIGITILLLVVVRLLYRVTHRPPSLPEAMSPTERRTAQGSHGVLYAMMLAMPLSGWALVSVSVLGIPTILYGLVRWPDLPVLSSLSDKSHVEDVMKLIHAWGAYILIGLVSLHALAALRHHLMLHDDVLRRMLPKIPSRHRSSPR